jgi:hypothetical protein
VPVISLEGAMGVLLYGMAAVVESVDGMSEERGEVAGRDMRVEKWDRWSSWRLTLRYAVQLEGRQM